MGRKILLCGGNGAGKTTLGKALAALSGYTFRDTEDYYFPRQEDGYAYGKSRTKAQVAALLVLSYAADRRRKNELQRLEDSGISVLVRTTDPNVTVGLVSRLFGVDSASVLPYKRILR